ncbi:hypothetical protein FRC12_002643 [Ceratobasidium sp. 428]|nr:hypothetical protein FRC12_002643 [Ceratobasidium sp. 428]
MPDTQPAPDAAVSAALVASARTPMPMGIKPIYVEFTLGDRPPGTPGKKDFQLKDVLGLSSPVYSTVFPICVLARVEARIATKAAAAALNDADKSVEDMIKEVRNTTIKSVMLIPCRQRSDGQRPYPIAPELSDASEPDTGAKAKGGKGGEATPRFVGKAATSTSKSAATGKKAASTSKSVTTTATKGSGTKDKSTKEPTVTTTQRKTRSSANA